MGVPGVTDALFSANSEEPEEQSFTVAVNIVLERARRSKVFNICEIL
jgi:hypothetical protein